MPRLDLGNPSRRSCYWFFEVKRFVQHFPFRVDDGSVRYACWSIKYRDVISRGWGGTYLLQGYVQFYTPWSYTELKQYEPYFSWGIAGSCKTKVYSHYLDVDPCREYGIPLIAPSSVVKSEPLDSVSDKDNILQLIQSPTSGMIKIRRKGKGKVI